MAKTNIAFFYRSSASHPLQGCLLTNPSNFFAERPLVFGGFPFRDASIA